MTNETFNVVFQYTREAGGYEGVITWTSFKNEADFNDWYTPDIERRERVIARGVTQEKAIELVRQTPAACDLASCVEEATDPETGELNPEIFQMRLTTVALARSLSRRADP
jgi:hypothetical protein